MKAMIPVLLAALFTLPSTAAEAACRDTRHASLEGIAPIERRLERLESRVEELLEGAAERSRTGTCANWSTPPFEQVRSDLRDLDGARSLQEIYRREVAECGPEDANEDQQLLQYRRRIEELRNRAERIRGLMELGDLHYEACRAGRGARWVRDRLYGARASASYAEAVGRSIPLYFEHPDILCRSPSTGELSYRHCARELARDHESIRLSEETALHERIRSIEGTVELRDFSRHPEWTTSLELSRAAAAQ